MLALLPLLVLLLSVSMVSAQQVTKDGYILPGDPITSYTTPGLTTLHDKHGNSMNVRPVSPNLSTYTTSDGRTGTIYQPFVDRSEPQLNSPAPPRQLQPCPPGSYQRFC